MAAWDAVLYRFAGHASSSLSSQRLKTLPPPPPPPPPPPRRPHPRALRLGMIYANCGTWTAPSWESEGRSKSQPRPRNCKHHSSVNVIVSRANYSCDDFIPANGRWRLNAKPAGISPKKTLTSLTWKFIHRRCILRFRYQTIRSLEKNVSGTPRRVLAALAVSRPWGACN